jgi:hypothetical protein
MSIDRENLLKALEGMRLIQNPNLWEEDSRPTAAHRLAINSVNENLNTFRYIIKEELRKFPNTNRFFGQLISERLFQDYPLTSPIIQKLFPFGLIELEERLSRILHLPHIETTTANVHAPKESNKGDETDEIIRDIWAEFFIADFLLTNMPKIIYLEKVVREKSQPAIEFYIQKENEEWIVEVARLRKRDFQGDTMPWSSQNCTNPENVAVIQNALRLKLFDKNRQIKKFVEAEKRDFEKRIVAIKTSQEEYQDCKGVILEESNRLMKENSYPEITHLLLIYDIKTYDFVENLKAR